LAGDFFADGAFLAEAFLAGDFLVADAADLLVAVDFFAAGVGVDFLARADEDVVTVFSVFAVVFLAVLLAGAAFLPDGFAAVLFLDLPAVAEACELVAFPPGNRRVTTERSRDPAAGFTGTINLTNR
jgi:hypothetical protein